MIRRAPMTPSQFPRTGMAILCALAMAAAACSTSDVEVIGPDTAETDGTADVQVDTDTGDQPIAAIEANFVVEGAEGTLLGLTADFAKALPKDDKYPAKAGIQVDVVVTTTAADGAQVTLRLDNNPVGAAQTVKAGKATFSEVDIGCSTAGSTLELTVTPAQGNPAVKYKKLQLDCSDACTVQLDASTAACVTEDIDPATAGLQHNVLVTSLTAGCNTLTLTGVDAKGAAISQTKVLDPGVSKATFLVTLSPDDQVPYGSVAKLQAVAKDAGLPTRPSVPSAETTLKVTNERPVVAISEPDAKKIITLLADANPALPGIQTLIKGTATTVSPTDPGASVAVTVGTDPTTTVLLAGGEFQAPVSFGAAGAYTVTVKATNGCGLSNEPPTKVTLQVNPDVAKITLLSPQAGATLLAKDDLAPTSTDSYQTQVVVAVKDGTPGSQISVYCRKAGLGNPFSSTPHGSAILAADATSTAIPVDLSILQLSTSVTCELRDDAPNPAVPTSFDWTIGLPPPTLTVASPQADPVLVNSKSLAVVLKAENLAGAQVSYTVTSSQGVLLESQPFAAVKGTAASGTVALPGDGTFTVTFEAIDVFGNAASASLGSDPTLTVVLDTQAPTLKFTAPTKSSLDPFDDPDADPAIKGYQIAVAVQFDDAVEVCLVTSSGEKTCSAPLPGEHTAVFTGISLQAGPNTLTASATDAAGNSSGPVPLLVTFVSDAPAVTFLNPLGDLITTQDSYVFKVSVNKGGAGGPPISGAISEVEVDGTVDPGIAVSEVSPGVYQFAVSKLSVKAQTKVRFGAAAVGAESKIGYTQALTVTYKSTKPTIAVDSPPNGSVLNIASPLCVSGPLDCQAQLKLTTKNAEDGSLAQVTVACGTNLPITATATVQGDAALISDAVFKDQTTCTLTAQVTDGAGQVALAAPVTVTVDRQAPVVEKMVLPAVPKGGQFTLVAKADVDGDPTNGMQVNLIISAAGVAKGQVVVLNVTADNGSVTKLQAVVPDDAKQDQFINVSFGLVSLPDGDAIKLAFTAVDQAGNPGEATFVGSIRSAAALALMADPVNNAEGVSCKTSAECGASICAQGKCAGKLNANQALVVSVSITGVPAGGDLAICSNAAGLAGPACATAGYKQIATAKVKSAIDNVVALPKLPDGLYTFMAEVRFETLIPWTSSLASPTALTKQRTVLIDTIAPVVVELTPPAATGALAACLNESSQSTGDAGQAGGKFTFAVKTSEEASVSVTANGTQVGSAKTAGNAGSVPVALAQEGTAVFAATAADLVGNISVAKVFSTVTVDTQKPIGAFANPNSKLVLAGANLDVLVASPSPDTAGQQTTVRDAGVLKATVPMSGGQALFSHSAFNILTQGNHTLQADLRDLCGNTTGIATSPAQITVDTVPPTLTIASPAQAANFADANDASPSTGGYQVAVTFGTADAASWQLELAEGCDASFGNCSGGYTKVAQGNVTAPGGNEPPVLVNIPFGTATPNYSLRLTGTDVNGNSSTATRGIKVQLSGCLVSLQGVSNGGTYNTSACTVPGKDCAAILVQLTAQHVGPCGTVAHLQFKKGSVEVAKKVPSGQSATQAIDLKDGDNTTVEVVALDGAGKAIASSGAQPVKADLTLPKVIFAAGSVLTVPTPAGTSMVVVGAAKDLNGQPGHQIHLLVQSTDAGLAGGKLTKLERTVAGVTQPLSVSQPASLPLQLAGNDVLTELQYAVLAENATNTVTATVADAAGNVGVGQIAVLVDWVAPEKIALADFAATDLNARRPSARLSFTAVGDNGNTGKANSYEVRYSSSPINSAADFDAACDAKSLPLSTVGSPLAAGASDQVFVEGPDPRPAGDPCKFAPLTDGGKSAWYFAVAAVDAAGNRGTPSNTLSTTQLSLRYANVILAAGADANLRNRLMPLGDVNGDGLGDFSVGGGLSAPVCVVYGVNGGSVSNIDLSAVPNTLASPLNAYPKYTCLPNPGGAGVPVAGRSDLNGDGIGDFAYGVGTGTGVKRKVLVYLGANKASIATTPAVEITGIDVTAGDGAWKLALIGNFNGDSSIDGKPIGDLALTTKAGPDATYDRVFVVPGSTAWSSAAPKTIDLTNAVSRALNSLAMLRISDFVGVSNFGSMLMGADNILPDSGSQQFADLAIGHFAAPQSVYVIKGRSWPAKTELELALTNAFSTNNPVDATAVQIRGTPKSGANAFGVYGALASLDGDAVPDLVLQHSGSTVTGGGGLYWLFGATLAANLGKIIDLGNETAVTGEANLFTVPGGYKVRDYHFGVGAIGNFADRQGSGGPFIDIIHGRGTTAPDGANNRVLIRLGLLRPKSAIANQAGLQTIDLVIQDPASPGKTGWGIITTGLLGPVSVHGIGDFNGDGLPDLVIGSTDSSLVVVY